jgi:hypothetical protein
VIPGKLFLKWLDLRADIRTAGEAYRAKYNPIGNAGKGTPEWQSLARAEAAEIEFVNKNCGGFPVPSQEQYDYMTMVEEW